MRVRAAAEADAAATRARGLASAEATRATGAAEATAAQAKGLAEAEGIKARAAALAENQEAVIAQQLAENWPAIVRAGAEAFAGVDHMVVLNGAEGVNDMLAKALTMGGAGLVVARDLLASLKPEAGAAADASAESNGNHRSATQIPIDAR